MKGCAPSLRGRLSAGGRASSRRSTASTCPIALGPLERPHREPGRDAFPLGVRARLACGGERALRGPGGRRSREGPPLGDLRHRHGVARRACCASGATRSRAPTRTSTRRCPRSSRRWASTIRSPYARRRTCPQDADLVVIGNALSRGNPEVEAVLDRRQRMTSLPALAGRGVPARAHARWWWRAPTARPRPRACSPSCWTAPASIRRSWSAACRVDFGRSYRLGAGAHFVIEGDEYDCAFFDKRPKFVHYLPDVAVDRQRRVRPRRHLSRPRGGADGVPPAAARDPAARPAGGRQSRARRSRELLPRRALPRRDLRRSAGRRTGGPSTCGRVRAATRFRLLRGGRDAGRVPTAARGRAQRPQRAGRARGRRGRRASRPTALREALAAFRGVKRRLELRGAGAGRDGLRRLRPPSRPRCGRRSKRCAASAANGPRSWPSSSRAPTPRGRGCSRTTSRARSGRPIGSIVAAAHLPGKVPEGQRLSEAELVDGDPARGGRGPSFVPGGRRRSSSAWRRSCAEGDRVVDPLERRLRRDPREAAARARGRA